jgi:folate-binding protein YgfZ
MTKRRILSVSGSDARTFLQTLVTNDVDRVDHGLVYAALLTPQGKYIADFFLSLRGEAILIDVAESRADALQRRLTMYKLRADVKLDTERLHVHRGLGTPPEDGFADPRHPGLGWRAYRSEPQSGDRVDWNALSVAYAVPEADVELTDDTFILEAGFERLSGVDFRKGCYVGQEVTARMKHKTELRKGLARVAVDGEAKAGTPITCGGKPAGQLLRVAGNEGIAYLRFDRATGTMDAGSAMVKMLA